MGAVLVRQVARARTRARTTASRNRRHGPMGMEAPAGPGWSRAWHGVARDASGPRYGQIGVAVQGGPPCTGSLRVTLVDL